MRKLNVMAGLWLMFMLFVGVIVARGGFALGESSTGVTVEARDLKVKIDLPSGYECGLPHKAELSDETQTDGKNFMSESVEGLSGCNSDFFSDATKAAYDVELNDIVVSRFTPDTESASNTKPSVESQLYLPYIAWIENVSPNSLSAPIFKHSYKSDR